MSTFMVEIVRIGEITKHPNADALSMTKVYEYTVIFKSSELKQGDLAVYFPIDSVLPNEPVFSFLWKDKEPTEWHRTVKATRLRGVFSEGLLIPLTNIVPLLSDRGYIYAQDEIVGENIADKLGIYKYEAIEPVNTKGLCEKQPEWFRKYTDIEAGRKYANKIFTIGEPVIVTEKIHGANARFCWAEDRFWIGSHAMTKKLGEDDIWNVVAKNTGLADICKDYPGLIFFGEVFGQVQGGWNYGLEKGRNSFVLFDVYDLKEDRYFDHAEVEEIARRWTPHLEMKDSSFKPFSDYTPLVPTVYSGPWLGIQEMEKCATGPSLMPNAKNIREGIVIKPIRERYNDATRRTIVKMHNPEFLIATGKKKKEGPNH